MVAEPLAGRVLGSTKDSFAMAEWRDEGGPPGPPRMIAPLHKHLNDDEAWYVLEGTLCVQRGHEVVEVPAGAGVLVRRGTAHTYWNPGPAPARYLLFMTPTVLRLIQAIHGLQDRSALSLKALFEKYDSELLG